RAADRALPRLARGRRPWPRDPLCGPRGGRPVKVLAVNKFFHVRGGADRYFFETIAALERHGHVVIPFSTAHPQNHATPYADYFSPLGGTEDDLVSLSVPGKARRFANGVYSFEAARRVERLVRDTRPDVVHVHNILYQITPSIFPVFRR